MALQEWVSVAREEQVVDELFRRLEGGFRGTDPAAGLLQPIASFIGAQRASIRLVTPADPCAIPAPLALLEIPDAVGDAYLGRYCELDPARNLPRRGQVGPVFADPDRPGQWLGCVESDVSQRSRAQFRQYLRDFLVPFDLVHHAGFHMKDAAERTLLFDFHRGRNARPFDRLETARMHVVARFLHARIAARWNPAPQAPPVRACSPTLSAREAEIARAVAAGLSNKAIAADFRISVRTVENHMRSIFGKLAVGSRTQLAARLHQCIPGTRH